MNFYDNDEMSFYNNDTKEYLNKAMDIYNATNDKPIEKNIRTSILSDERTNHVLTETEKKIFSLFVAAFLVDDDIKKILEKNNIKINDLFSFINIKENDIKKLNDNEYQDYYDKEFKKTLIDIKKNQLLFNYNILQLTPKVIFWLLENNNTRILGYFSQEHFGKFVLSSDIFEEVKEKAVLKGDIKKVYYNKIVPDSKIRVNKRSDKHKKLNPFPNDFYYELKILEELEEYEKRFINPKTLAHKSKDKKDDDVSFYNSDEIWEILEEIKKKFIGQEELAENLFYNILNNQQMALGDDAIDGQRSIIFIDGPTGTGKTAITKEITEKLKAPFISTSITNYSSTGYVGGNLTDTLKELYNKANGDLEKAQRGIVVFDEFDKIAYNTMGGLEMKKAVQQQLLDFLGGGKYQIDVGNNIFDKRKVEFDTSKLTFVCLGALTSLRDSKTNKKQPIGFVKTDELDNRNYNITPNDLIDTGLERELVGRINTYLHTEEYSKEDLLKILKESTISPLIGFRKWIESKGKKLEIEDGVYDSIASFAYELNTGARSLQTVVNNIRTHFIKEVLRGTKEVIYLDTKTVNEINNNSISRRTKR